MKRRSLIRRLTGDERGVSAIEFAFLAPVLITFYMGMTEFCQGFMAQKRMGHVAAMVADLVAQEQTVNVAALEDIFDIGDLIMAPFSRANLHQRVSSVRRLNGVDTVLWSTSDGMTEASTFTVPADMIASGETVIVAEVTYDYESAAKYLMRKPIRFRHVYYMRPRHVDQIPCTDCLPPA